MGGRGSGGKPGPNGLVIIMDTVAHPLRKCLVRFQFNPYLRQDVLLVHESKTKYVFH